MKQKDKKMHKLNLEKINKHLERSVRYLEEDIKMYKKLLQKSNKVLENKDTEKTAEFIKLYTDYNHYKDYRNEIWRR